MALPLILAGPIVRRVDAKVCSVWIALSSKRTVELRLWPGVQMSKADGTVESGEQPIRTGLALPFQLGKNLHVALVEIDLEAAPRLTLAPGAYFSYDIIIGAGGNLRTQKLLKDEVAGDRIPDVDPHAPLHLALGYVENRLPGFVVPAASIAALRIAHASCRNSNADGHDAMAWLDDRIAQDTPPFAERPQQLFLTGDQIYADDVASPILPMLARLAGDTMGGSESFPVTDTASKEVTGENFPSRRRGLVVREHAGMSTTESRDHLLSFGEFAAMYLAAWSPRVWSKMASVDEIFAGMISQPAATDAFLTDWRAKAVRDLAKLKEKDNSLAVPEVPLDAAGLLALKAHWDAGRLEKASVEHENGRATVYRALVPKAARVLANCITYMIWDDHEVTDDWNLCGRWLARVYAKVAGRAIVRNGGMAYAIFQAWGNDPAAFRTGKNREVLELAETLMAPAGSGPFPAEDPAPMNTLLGFPGADADSRAKWHYQVDGPLHRAVVLNTRTLRDPGSLGTFKPPKLLGDTLKAQLPAAQPADGRELLVLVSPVPVLNPFMLESIFQPAAAAVHDLMNLNRKKIPQEPLSAVDEQDHKLSFIIGAEQRDIEGWSIDEAHQEELLARLAGYPRVVILSGDVHFSCTLTLDYWKQGNPAPSRIIQLTSSGARNGWPLFFEAAYRRSTLMQDLLRSVLAERLAWEGPSSVTVPQGARIGPGRRARLKRTPSLLPVIGWPAGTTIAADKPPDWRWRLKMVVDVRPPGAADAPPEPQALGGPDINPADAFDGYNAVAKRHALETLEGPRLSRSMLFAPNVGLVSFEPAAGAPTLVHTLLSAASPESHEVGISTVHKASLAASVEAPPVLLFR